MVLLFSLIFLLWSNFHNYIVNLVLDNVLLLYNVNLEKNKNKNSRHTCILMCGSNLECDRIFGHLNLRKKYGVNYF